MSSFNAVETPTKTPIKIYHPRPNDYCRVCQNNVKINGCSQLNLFNEKNRDFLRRFRLVVDAEVENNPKILQVLCKKCYRAVLKNEKLLDKPQELQEFRLKYEEVTIDGEWMRLKRCAKNSPCNSPTNTRSPSTKTCSEPVNNPKSKRKILSDIKNKAVRNEEAVNVVQNQNSSPTEVRR
jgi:hypothetical protein